jgi:hypothetical protein
LLAESSNDVRVLLIDTEADAESADRSVETFHQCGHSIPVVLIASESTPFRALSDADATVLHRPFDMLQLASSISTALARHDAESSLP